MKKTAVLLGVLISSSALAEQNCNVVSAGNSYAYHACAKSVSYENGEITLTSPTLDGYDVKPKRVLLQMICEGFGGDYKSFSAKRFAKTFGIALGFVDLGHGIRDLEFQGVQTLNPNGDHSFRSHVTTKIVCAGNPSARATE